MISIILILQIILSIKNNEQTRTEFRPKGKKVDVSLGTIAWLEIQSNYLHTERYSVFF